MGQNNSVPSNTNHIPTINKYDETFKPDIVPVETNTPSILSTPSIPSTTSTPSVTSSASIASTTSICDKTFPASHSFEFRPFYESYTSSCITCGIQPMEFNIKLVSRLQDPNAHLVHVHVWDEDGECIAYMPNNTKSIPVCKAKRDNTKKNHEIFLKEKKTVVEHVPVETVKFKPPKVIWR